MEETLGKRIVANRKRLGITQDRLAEQLGVTAQAVSKWENDQSCPDITMLPKLAEIFGTTTDALLGLSEPEAVREAEIAEPVHTEEAPEGIHFQKGNWEFRMDTGRSSLLATAVLFIWVGTVYLLRIMTGQPTDLWPLLWPSALLIYGGFSLFRRFTFLRLGCTFLGACFLFSNMSDRNLSGAFAIPALLILLGFSLLVKAFRKSEKPHVTVIHNGKNMKQNLSDCSFGEDSFDISISFSEKYHVIDLPRLRSGSADVSFGNLTVDLTGCEAFGENCRIDADCSFGNLTILVPKSVRAEVDSDAAFGSVDIHGSHDSDTAVSLSIDADVSFGQIVVKYV